MLGPESSANIYYDYFNSRLPVLRANPILFDKTSFFRSYFDKGSQKLLAFTEEVESQKYSVNELMALHGIGKIRVAVLEDFIGYHYFAGSGKAVIEVAYDLTNDNDIADTIAHEVCHVLLAGAQIDSFGRLVYTATFRKGQEKANQLFEQYREKAVDPFCCLEEAWCENFITAWLDDYGQRAEVIGLIHEMGASKNMSLKLT